ncbi:MAG: hypothetical protein IJK79_10180 [Bacteroidales bacterium]|nr:hypothetical protein [Bacteroidales bacterium]
MKYFPFPRVLALALTSILLCLAGPLSAQTGSEGYYKDIFMDSGIRLTSKSDLPVARYLDLKMERFISAVTKELTAVDTVLQYATIVGSPIDENGILLYPDGAPRFRMIYVNGGLATQHGRSLTPEGRARIKEYIDAGGSYLGSCAGAFLCGRYMDTIETKPREYLNIWPGYGVDTGMSGTYTGMTLDKDSPLLKYNDFGGDRFVDSVFHNNGCYAVPLLEPGDAKTEVLLRYDADTMKLARPVHGRPSAWAYKQNERSGRVIAIGSHPESRGYGEILDLMAALVRYALDGNGVILEKGELKNGEPRVMDRRTADHEPAYTRIGDRQYHHFFVNVPKGAKTLTIELSTPAGWKDFDLYLFADRGKQAYRSSAPYKNVVLGSDKTLVIKDPKPGKLFISVFCATTVDTEETKYGDRYVGRTEVLNGIPYTIRTEIE